MLEYAVARAPYYLLVAVRCFALIMTMPLLSTRAVSRIAKVSLAGFMAFMLLPRVDLAEYAPYIAANGDFSLDYALLLLGEALIGIITGFYISIIFAAFSTAGQFFAFQIGFAASEVYDSLSQVENPLMGQFLNLVAMLVFLQVKWIQRIFLGGLHASFAALDAFSIVSANGTLARFMARGLTDLFGAAFVIALPVMGTLFLINVTMGVLAKAAPQMNLLAEGFPLMLLVAFTILTILLPQLCNFFVQSFGTGFARFERLLVWISGGGL